LVDLQQAELVAEDARLPLAQGGQSTIVRWIARDNMRAVRGRFGVTREDEELHRFDRS
jgi:hypothetical protein